MRRVRGKNHPVFGARTIFADGVHVLVEIVERRVRQPGFIEMQRIDTIAEYFLQHLDVIKHTIVG